MDYDAIRFSWIATADLADIAASASHPNGEPLFESLPIGSSVGDRSA